MNKTAKQSGGKKIYLKYLGILALSAVIGGIFGGLFTGTLSGSGIDKIIGDFVEQVGRNQLMIYVVMGVISAVTLETILAKMRKLGAEISHAEDENADTLEYMMEKVGAVGVLVSNCSQVLLMMVLSTGYNIDYIQEADGYYYIASITAFLLACVYLGIWQMRYVRLLQKIYPEKKGDPSSRKFQQQWLESCDEAEKEVIYQSSYKTYHAMNKLVPAMLLLALLSHLLWNTGLMAVFITGVIWIALSANYCRFCLRKKGENLMENRKK